MPRHPVIRCVPTARLTATFLAALPAAALAQSVVTIPPISGGATSNAMDLSADGSTVVGSSLVNSHNRALRWTAAGGSQDLGSLTAADARATGVSADGSVVCGFVGNSEANYIAFRWIAGNTSPLLMLNGGTYNQALSVSGDGQYFVGEGNSGQSGGLPVSWYLFGPGDPFSLGGAAATGVNTDGSFVCGYSGTGLAATGWRWSASGGTQTPLGHLPGGLYAYPSAISVDGSTVVGYGDTPTGNHAFRWTSAGMQDLGTLPGESGSVALSVSANGNAIVGWSGTRAWLWNAPPGGGMQDLATLLPARGIPLAGWTLSVASAISADGLTLAGNGVVGSQARAWTVHLACYANCDASTAAPVLNVTDFTCFLQKYAAGNAYANCDASTAAPVLNVTDFTCFLQKYASGCP